MSTIRWHTSMSLDGYVAGPDNAMGWMALDWLPPTGPEGLPPEMRRIADATGAILAGRNWHDALDRLGGLEGIYGGEWSGPVLVLTSRPDEGAPVPGVTFVTGGIEAAVDAARTAAAGRDVVLFGPTIAAQCLDAGLVDEVVVTLAPVLLGDGIRFYGGPVERHLEPVDATPVGHFLNLTYRVV